MIGGVLNLYKEKGFTSHDAVAKIRRLYGTKKVGHTGTLDPQAVGVLPILIGPAVKACDLIPEEHKVYRAKVRFGILTNTEDIWGEVLSQNALRPDKEAFREVMLSFCGPYDQIPPMVSAVKVNGKKLYEYAREGKVIPRDPRKVFVHRIELLGFTEEEAEIRAEVSKGTYIRTLLTDICSRLGVLGSMSELEREKSGVFEVDHAVTLGELENMTKEEREAVLFPTHRLFESYPKVELPAFFARLIGNGCAVSMKKMKLSFPVGEKVRLYQNGAFFALGEVIWQEGEEKLFAIKHFPEIL